MPSSMSRPASRAGRPAAAIWTRTGPPRQPKRAAPVPVAQVVAPDRFAAAICRLRHPFAPASAPRSGRPEASPCSANGPALSCSPRGPLGIVMNPNETSSHFVDGTRRLAAILAADIVGYSKLMGRDEEGTLARVKRSRREIVDPTLAEHHGRLIKTTGDGFLAMFDSPLEAVRCAIVIQQMMRARNTSLSKEQWLQYRMGVNLGDVIVDSDDIYGDGVNIAARLESMAEPGGVNISGGVYEQIKNKLVCGYQSLGDEKLKNITDPVRIYRVLPDPSAVSRASGRGLRWSSFIPAAVLALIGAGLYAYTFDLYPNLRAGPGGAQPVAAPVCAAVATPETAPPPKV